MVSVRPQLLGWPCPLPGSGHWEITGTWLRKNLEKPKCGPELDEGTSSFILFDEKFLPALPLAAPMFVLDPSASVAFYKSLLNGIDSPKSFKQWNLQQQQQLTNNVRFFPLPVNAVTFARSLQVWVSKLCVTRLLSSWVLFVISLSCCKAEWHWLSCGFAVELQRLSMSVVWGI